ncbi:MAG: sensor histidine kinase [Novosphingobium sp.]
MSHDAPMSDAELFTAIVEHSDAAIIAKDLKGTVLAWNRAAEKVFGWSAGEMIGQSIRRLIPDDRQSEEDLILAAIRRGETVDRLETVRLHKNGNGIDIAVLVSPIRNPRGEIIGASKIARDITEELQLRRNLAEVQTRFALLADNIPQLAWIADTDGAIFWLNERWFEYTGLSYEEAKGHGWQQLVLADHLPRINAKIAVDLASGADWEETIPIRGRDGEYRWFLARAVAQRDAAGTIMYWFGTATDVTKLRDAERRIELLLMEVNHRSKNLLSVVQSLARRTAASGEDFIPRLEQRIAALAANQDVLVQRDWSPVPLRALIDAQLSVIEQAAGQTEIIGPEVVIQAKTAEALSMAIHELAHNAEKYGAYSVPQGQVAVGWRVEGDGDAAEFVLEWGESGGPEVSQPSRSGFGSRIIRDVPKARLSGEVEMDFPPTGFRFTLRCPAANVLA